MRSGETSRASEDLLYADKSTRIYARPDARPPVRRRAGVDGRQALDSNTNDERFHTNFDFGAGGRPAIGFAGRNSITSSGRAATANESRAR